jgi:hypothetical protein
VSSRPRRPRPTKASGKADRSPDWRYAIELSLELEADSEYLVFGPRVRQSLELARDGHPKLPDFDALSSACRAAQVPPNLLPFAWVVRLNAEPAGGRGDAGGEFLAVERRVRCDAVTRRRFREIFEQLRSELDRALWVDRGASPQPSTAPLDPFRLFGGEST